MKKIAIIGAGFAGLALARYLADFADITLYDEKGIGGGASGIAAGLMHPFVGFKARFNWRGHEAMDASKALFAETGGASSTPLLRLVTSPHQLETFPQTAADHASVDFLDDASLLLKDLTPRPALYIKDAFKVNCSFYLQSLFNLCASKGVRLIQESIHNPDLLPADLVILAIGAKAASFIPLQLIKGQLLQLEWPASLPPLPFPLIGDAYIVMEPDGKSCWVGATYERTFHDDKPDLSHAKELIMPHVKAFIPALANASILNCQAGIRAFTKDRRPKAIPIGSKTWVFTGLGSKGLLYHALLAKEFASTLYS